MMIPALRHLSRLSRWDCDLETSTADRLRNGADGLFGPSRRSEHRQFRHSDRWCNQRSAATSYSDWCLETGMMP